MIAATALAKYDDVSQALAEIVHIPEVKDFHDKAAAMQDYAKRAKDPVLIELATVARKRAEIRAGEMLAATPKNTGGGDRKSDRRSPGATGDLPTLADLKVTKSQSSRWQQLAALPHEAREEVIGRAVKYAIHAIERKPHNDNGRKPRQPKSLARQIEAVIAGLEVATKADRTAAAAEIKRLAA